MEATTLVSKWGQESDGINKDAALVHLNRLLKSFDEIQVIDRGNARGYIFRAQSWTNFKIEDIDMLTSDAYALISNLQYCGADWSVVCKRNNAVGYCLRGEVGRIRRSGLLQPITEESLDKHKMEEEGKIKADEKRLARGYEYSQWMKKHYREEIPEKHVPLSSSPGKTRCHSCNLMVNAPKTPVNGVYICPACLNQ
jgi:hypothetical protein